MQRKLNTDQIASVKEIQFVIAYLNNTMLGAVWSIANDFPSMQCKVDNFQEADDVIHELKRLYPSADLNPTYNLELNAVTINSYVIKEIFEGLIGNASLFKKPTNDQLGYSGDGRLHYLITDIMNSPALGYKVTTTGI